MWAAAPHYGLWRLIPVASQRALARPRWSEGSV